MGIDRERGLLNIQDKHVEHAAVMVHTFFPILQCIKDKVNIKRVCGTSGNPK